MRKLTHPELLLRQSQKQQLPKISLTVVVPNLRSLYNVGSIFRTADAVGAEKLWLCGITGIPPANQISKTALDAEKVVSWEYAEKADRVLDRLREAGYEIVMLEQTSQSIPYEEYIPKRPVCLVLGNEISGVGDDLLPHCNLAVEIEMAGVKNSLNVTVAFGVVAYHLRRHLLANHPIS